jgi:hypothetical protein
MKLIRHSALFLLLALGFSAAAVPAGQTAPPAGQTAPPPAADLWAPATPEEALIHLLDQAAAADEIARSTR